MEHTMHAHTYTTPNQSPLLPDIISTQPHCPYAFPIHQTAAILPPLSSVQFPEHSNSNTQLPLLLTNHSFPESTHLVYTE